jgi:hypothetical protein
LAQLCACRFEAKYDDKPILEALAAVRGGLGEYISTRVWEVNLMIELKESEEVYTRRPVTERARMIAAQQLLNLMGVLENNRVRLEIEAQNQAATV